MCSQTKFDNNHSFGLYNTHKRWKRWTSLNYFSELSLSTLNFKTFEFRIIFSSRKKIKISESPFGTKILTVGQFLILKPLKM